MTLASGTKLGPYEILSPIGAGGMGEVYRARDTRLKREVAVKVLPTAFAADAERLKRFEQEAQAASALNHPNILSIYDLGTHEEAPYIVSELLEGETLRSRLAGGAFTPRKAIGHALQISQGLAAAHEKGIVHRDLKPENIFVTNDGRVKILDFGLARVTRPEGGSSTATNLPTITPGTEPGMVLGTLGYMSPEQVRGKVADARSDIFSFGAILYEMLSGKRAFHADTAADTISAILTKEPPDVSETNKRIPESLDRIVRHCLEKNPEARFHSASDVAFDLEAISGTPTQTAGAKVTEGRSAFRAPLWALVISAAAALLAGVLVGHAVSKPELPATKRLTFRKGRVRTARFAPDGQTILYTASWQGGPNELYSTRSDSTESRSLGLPGSMLAAVSSSGELAVLRNAMPSAGGGLTFEGTLARLPLAGGAPRDLLEGVQFADWAPDGDRLAVVRYVAGKNRLESPVGTVLYETPGWIESPRFSPSGDRIAFIDYPVVGDVTGGTIAFVDMRGRKTTLSRHFSGGSGPAWAPGGDEIWFTAEGSLHAITISGHERVLFQSVGEFSLHDVSHSGRSLVTRFFGRRETHGKAPGETTERDLSWLDVTLPIQISHDGKTVLLNEFGEGGGPEHGIYLRSTDGSLPVHIGDGSAFDLSPDGRSVMAIAHFGTPKQRLLLLPSGAGQSRELPTEALGYENGGFTPDGKQLVISGSRPGGAPRTYVQDLAGGPPRPITPEGFTQRVRDNFAVSSDGRILVRDRDSKPYIAFLRGGDPRPIPGVSPVEYMAGWAADGRLYVVQGSPLPARVSLIDPATGRREDWKQIQPADPAGVEDIDWFLATPEGTAYVYCFARGLTDLYLLTGVH